MDLLKRIGLTASEYGERTAFRSRAGEINYGDLWERSGRLASYIYDKLGKGSEPLMVYGHKSPDMLVCFLACVRSGRAYCPVDTSMPPERVRSIADKIGNRLILATEDVSEIFAETSYGIPYEVADVDIIRTASESFSVISPDMRVRGEDVFYIIFTSGSTGEPKGVMISADNLNCYLAWSTGLAGGIPEGSVFLNQAPFSFDLSVMDLYTGFATGSTIVSVDKKQQQDIPVMIDYISGAGITHWVSTPSFADMCFSDSRFCQKTVEDMKAFLFCGEVLTVNTAKELIGRFPSAKVINTYGPTESTVCVTEVEITAEMTASEFQLPIGMSKPGTEIMIDPATGEIIIAGDTVSPGYFGDEERTGKAFFTTESGARAYRTGDAGHFDESGMLYCDGRLDRQIKLHGYRMELDDIEANLLKIEGVSMASVLPKTKNGKVGSLAAFVVADTSVIGEGYAGRKHIRTELAKKLPSYMIPKVVKTVDSIPLTANGKADRKKLEEML